MSKRISIPPVRVAERMRSCEDIYNYIKSAGTGMGREFDNAYDNTFMDRLILANCIESILLDMERQKSFTR